MDFIKEIFWDMPVEMWEDSFIGKFIALLWFALVMLLTIFLFWGVFSIADRAFLDYVPGEAKIMGKRFDPAHEETYMTSVQSGNTTIMVPQTTSYPDRYYLQLEVKGLYGEEQIDLSTYNEMKEGKVINVKYSKRRFTDELSFE